MKHVYILFSADCNLSYASYSIEAVCTTQEKAIKLITPILKRVSKKSYRNATYNTPSEMLTDLLSNLRDIGQTQTLDTNYVIKAQELNVLSCL